LSILPSLGVIPSFNSEGSTYQPDALTALTNQQKLAIELNENINTRTDLDLNPVPLTHQIENSLVTVSAPFSATCSERLFPTEPAIVGEIVDAMMDGRIDKNTHLLIRCHPADFASRYDQFCSSGRVTIFPSSLKENKNLAEWIPSEDELEILTATLRHSDLCINTASTMILDAFASGKPVINIGYSVESKDYLQSPLRYYDYFHLQPIASSGAAPIVKSSLELIDEINKAIDDPNIYQEKRQFVVENFCPRPKDGSVSFIVDEIRKYCSG